MIPGLKEQGSFTTTFNTTEDCNLRCRYCYEINKKKKELPLEYAKMYIDHIINDPDPADLLNDPDPVFRAAYKNGWCMDFIGGDSFMNPDLLDQILTYALKTLLLTPNDANTKIVPFKRNVKASVSTNGTLFGSPKVKDLCEKYKDILLVGVSIDGCPEIHDKYRVFPDGTGSMKYILKYWDWYKNLFPYYSLQTKATASVATIPYLCESLKFMHETLGIKYIMQNFIMEDSGATEADYDLLDRELEKCVEYVLQHRHDIYWSPFGKEQFATAHLSSGDDWNLKGHCGSGAMPALSTSGLIYPCHRWLPHTFVDKSAFIVGDVWNGFNHKENFKKVREGAYRCNCTKDEKCKTCEYESACSYCIGGCYSEFGEFRRTTYICEYTKLQVKWARKYWDAYNELEGLPKVDWEEESQKTEYRRLVEQ